MIWATLGCAELITDNGTAVGLVAARLKLIVGVLETELERALDTEPEGELERGGDGGGGVPGGGGGALGGGGGALGALGAPVATGVVDGLDDAELARAIRISLWRTLRLSI